MLRDEADEPAVAVRRLPGDEGLWFFLAADLALFLALFGSFSSDRAADPLRYALARHALMPPIATLNTILLLTASWLAATAVHAMRRLQVARATRLTAGAALLGLGFVVVKISEYSIEVGSGVLPTSNGFFMYYFIITGIHLMHVIGGCALLTVAWVRLRRSDGAARDLQLLESGASLWHIVDILWLVIFPMFYLLP